MGNKKMGLSEWKYCMKHAKEIARELTGKGLPCTVKSYKKKNGCRVIRLDILDENGEVYDYVTANARTYEETTKYLTHLKNQLLKEHGRCPNKEYLICLKFLNDDGKDDFFPCMVTVPENLSEKQVMKILDEAHDYLCSEEREEDIYGIRGYSAQTLAEYVSGKNGWKLEYPDIALTLE